MKRLLAACLSCLVLLVACTAAPAKARQLDAWALPASPKEERPITTIQYNFGQKHLASAPVEVSYAVQGVISLPRGGKGPYPLVLILHGSHENIAEDARYDLGFTYLCEALAKHGYAAASLDLNVAYLWHLGENDLEKTIEITHHHLMALRAMVQAPTQDYAVLKNKIDFSKIVLMGHSRGGGSIFEIAGYEAYNGNPISGLIAIAPALMAQRREFVDIPSHILVPELDGDLTDLQGYYLSYAVRDSHQKSITSVTLLEQANHNFFNQTLVEQDRNDARWFGPVTEYQLTAEQQQAFLVEYTLSLLDSIFSGEERIFYSGRQSPTSLFGQKAPVIFYQPDREPLLDILDGNAVKALENTSVKNVVDSWFFKLDTARFFDSITAGMEEYQTKHLLQIDWEAAGGGVQIIPSGSDFSQKEALFLEVALNSAQFEADPQMILSITLTDARGKTATLMLPKGEPALRFVTGEKEIIDIADTFYYAYSKKTPIMGIWVPLGYWSGVNQKDIASVTLRFESGTKEPGGVMLEGCYLY